MARKTPMTHHTNRRTNPIHNTHAEWWEKTNTSCIGKFLNTVNKEFCLHGMNVFFNLWISLTVNYLEDVGVEKECRFCIVTPTHTLTLVSWEGTKLVVVIRNKILTRITSSTKILTHAWEINNKNRRKKIPSKSTMSYKHTRLFFCYIEQNMERKDKTV
jgi:hypothetical protein